MTSTSDWSRVSPKHIRQACQLFDLGEAAPRRQVQSLFLVFGGKRYPAKFIRGLAYRLATGVDADGKRHSSSSEDTIKFFESHGMETERGPLQLVRTPTPNRKPSRKRGA